MTFRIASATSSCFTFHNVSINTDPNFWNNHCLTCFTFHNVSINTVLHLQPRQPRSTLHSTMFLLIQIFLSICGGVSIVFTFHNVSINTEPVRIPIHEGFHFTFHNVSINTRAPHSPIIHRLFYHFLSTLSFTIILYTK